MGGTTSKPEPAKNKMTITTKTPFRLTGTSGRNTTFRSATTSASTTTSTGSSGMGGRVGMFQSVVTTTTKSNPTRLSGMGGTTSTPEPAKMTIATTKPFRLTGTCGRSNSLRSATTFASTTTSTGSSGRAGTVGMFQPVVTTTTRPNPTGLSRMYGYFMCSGCRQQWESSHVYCRQGTVTAAYGQDCKKCHITCMPYRVEKIQCSGCGETTCVCVHKQQRHIDVNKHHRRDLCAKCKAGLPCTRGF